MPAMQLYLLWDSSVVVPYYVPDATNNKRAVQRAQIILDSVRNHRTDAFCYIPNVVVAEVFAAFDREHLSTWDPVVYKKYGGNGRSLHGAKYQSARRTFRRDIHNGALFYQMELNRYHILSLDLISPVDKYRKFYRTRGVKSMGASDLLIGAMALHLTKIHGRDRVRLLTADRRMKAIFESACPGININTARSLGLLAKAKDLGFGAWSPDIYPGVIDLERSPDKELAEFFGGWPLATRKTRGRAPKA